jgi:uncharacterized protein (DUF2141 family)
MQKQSRLSKASRRVAALFAILLIISFAHSASSKAAESDNRLDVRVVGMRNDKGNLNCSLFKPNQDFPTNNQHLARIATAPIANGTGTCEYSGLAPGNYAVVVFHDEDSDGKFKRSALGLPQEGYGFSKDAPARFRAPKFDEASFPFAGGTSEILLHIRY